MTTSNQVRAEHIDDPDRDVVDLVERGDVKIALHLLMKRHGTAVYRYCCNELRDPVLAEDVRQQVFIGAFRYLSRFNRRSSIRTWLFAIARNCVLYAVRARRRAQSYLQDGPAGDPPDPRLSPAESLDDIRLRQTLVGSLSRLDDSARSTLLLRYQQGLTFQEMAVIRREKPAALASRVARTLPLLRAEIESRIRARSGKCHAGPACRRAVSSRIASP